MNKILNKSNDLDAARGYLARGFAVVPVKAGQKRPKGNGWQKLRLKADELENHFAGERNVGIILGEPSGWLVDVDLDCDEAVEMADQYLPVTGMVSGRPSRPRSHWWYVAEGSKTHQFKDKHKGRKGMVVELRSTGAQTLVGPSLHPDGEHYHMLEGKPASVDAQELLRAVEALYKAVLARRYPEETSKADQFVDGGGSFDEVERRARAYLKKLPEAVSGEGGHDRTYRAAIAMVQGFCLNEETALRALREVHNPRCVPPWSEEELRHKVVQAATKAVLTNRQPRGWLINARHDDVDLSVIEADQRVVVIEPPEEAEPTALDPGSIPENLLRVPGFVSEVMDYCLATAPYPNTVMAFCGALALQAVLAGRKMRDSGDNRTNLYLLGLAHSSAGKDRPRKVNTEILHAIGLSSQVGGHFASGEGVQDALFGDPCMLFQTDEIDGMLQSINKAKDARYENIIGTLLTLYSTANSVLPMRRKAGRESPGAIDQPCLVIFGTAIPNHYYEALSERMLTNGFFARMLILECGKRSPGQEPRIVTLPARVLRSAKWWANFKPGSSNREVWHPKPKTVLHTDEARAILVEARQEAEVEYTKAEAENETVGTTVCGRVSEHIRKLSLI
ncbi:MAG: bifunctional DNA primase/polymerase, partial [Planctomycetota bacterium]